MCDVFSRGIPNVRRNVFDLSGGYTASSPTRRAFWLVNIPLIVVLHKASPFRRGGRVADGEVYRREPSVAKVLALLTVDNPA
jgi:hypothetical protein